jgi:hypothetical protein
MIVFISQALVQTARWSGSLGEEELEAIDGKACREIDTLSLYIVS